jgi:hypothetical protein
MSIRETFRSAENPLGAAVVDVRGGASTTTLVTMLSVAFMSLTAPLFAQDGGWYDPDKAARFSAMNAKNLGGLALDLGDGFGEVRSTAGYGIGIGLFVDAGLILQAGLSANVTVDTRSRGPTLADATGPTATGLR